MGVMPAIEPLNECEEFAWRSLSRVIVVAPRLLDDDLQRDAQMGLSEYTVLVHLSEARDSMLRVAQLADRAYLSGSRVTRLVDQLAREGLVEKERSEHDRRGTEVRITEKGLARLKGAYPAHLRSVRSRIVDHLDPSKLALFGRMLADVPLGDGLPDS
jgi:DNA-binding MarR family transcriptional regulator